MAETELKPKLLSRFSTVTTTRMTEAHKHIVPMPAWCNFTGIARLVVAILVLAFTAAATGIWGGYSAFGFTLFTACATLIIFAYHFVALSQKPKLYNRWAVLGLEMFGVIFWLVSFSLCAEWTSVYNAGIWRNGHTSYGFWNASFSPKDIGLHSRGLKRRSANKYQAGVALAGTAAGLGALEFVLFVVTLVIFSINLHKHRTEGYPSVSGGAMKPITPKIAPVAAAPTEKEDMAAKMGSEETTETVVKKDDSAVV